MGANNSTRRVSFESDDNDNVTVVKGIRLSENVIKRMREPAAHSKPNHAPSPHTSVAPTLPTSPLLQPVPPLVEPITSMPPPLPLVEPVAPPSATETVAAPPQPSTEQVVASNKADLMLAPSASTATANAVADPAFKPVATPPLASVDRVTLPTPPSPPAHTETLTSASCHAPAVVEAITPLAPFPSVIDTSPSPISQPIASSPPLIKPIAPPASPCVPEPVSPPPPLVKSEPITSSPLLESESCSFPPVFKPVTILPAPLLPPGDTLSSQPAEPLATPPFPEFTSTCEPVAPPPQPTVETLSPAPVPEPVARPESSPAPPPAAASAADEEALRKKFTDELNKGFEQDRAKAKQEMQAWFDAEKARTSAQAQAAAQSQVQAEVSRMLSAERALAQEDLQQALIRERITTEDERLRAQILATQLEAREADLKKQDAFYRDQVARLEDRSAQLYKVTTENYHKAADQVNAKFKRYEANPVCADLQGQILLCYKENAGKTLNCSNIAALYLQCVNNAKQNKLRTGG